jgi:hypothetical protein
MRIQSAAGENIENIQRANENFQKLSETAETSHQSSE